MPISDEELFSLADRYGVSYQKSEPTTPVISEDEASGYDDLQLMKMAEKYNIPVSDDLKESAFDLEEQQYKEAGGAGPAKTFTKETGQSFIKTAAADPFKGIAAIMTHNEFGGKYHKMNNANDMIDVYNKLDIAAAESPEAFKIAANRAAPVALSNKPREDMQDFIQYKKVSSMDEFAVQSEFGKTKNEILKEIRGRSRKRYAEAFEGLKDVLPADQRDLYKAGQAVSEFAEETIPVSDEERKFNKWSSLIGSGVGSTGGFLLTGLGGRAIKLGSMAPTIMTGAAVNASQVYEDAKSEGASEEDATSAAFAGGLVGTSEGAPIERLLDMVGKGGATGIKRILTEAAKQGTVEAAQEAFQNIANNLIASDVVKYDEDRQMFEGAGEGATVGFSVGSLYGTVFALVSGRRGRGADGKETLEAPEIEGDTDKIDIKTPSDIRGEEQLALPAPKGSGEFEAGPQGVREKTESESLADQAQREVLAELGLTQDVRDAQARREGKLPPIEREADIESVADRVIKGGLPPVKSTGVGSKSNIGVPESSFDGGLSASDLFGNSPDAEAISVHGFDSLNRDRQHMVLSRVRARMNDEKVLNSIIKSVPVDVMDVLIGQEGSSDMLLHNPSVLAHRLSVSRNEPIPVSVVRFIDSLSSSVGNVSTGDRTKESGLSAPDAASLSGKGRTAIVTGDGYSGQVTKSSVAGQSIEVDVNPTEKQKQAGNYKKGSLRLHGLDIAIENIKGSERTGIDSDGETWSATMPTDYGYIKRTEGADGDHVDTYIGPNPSSEKVFVIDQKDLGTGRFDEHKTLIGYDSLGQAVQDYENAFSDGRGTERIGAEPTEMTMNQFKEWVKNGDTTKPVSESFEATIPEATIEEQRLAAEAEKRQRSAPIEQEPQAQVEVVRKAENLDLFDDATLGSAMAELERQYDNTDTPQDTIPAITQDMDNIANELANRARKQPLDDQRYGTIPTDVLRVEEETFQTREKPSDLSSEKAWDRKKSWTDSRISNVRR